MPRASTLDKDSRRERLLSIDAFRALTMILMLWVNDFWTLSGVPQWLQHQPAEADALGFSDVIFPAFLFVVGLSIPFALSNRKTRGETTVELYRHIAERSFALILMGLFMVNLEYISPEATHIGKYSWQILMTLAFFLIWNIYPKAVRLKSYSNYLKGTGYLILVFLALTYKGTGDSGAWMKIHWWGILGLIGWCYLLASLICLHWGHRIWVIGGAWLGFALFNIADFAGILEFLGPIRDYVWIVSSGALPAVTMSGVFISTLYLRASKKEIDRNFPIWQMLVLGLVVTAIGFLLRPYWGISKIQATPAWVEICTGLSILSFAALYWLVDIKGKVVWMKLIRPAGVATLTCYLVPYLFYAIVGLLDISLPAALRTGSIGLAKSMLFAFLIVGITGLLTRAQIRLKI